MQRALRTSAPARQAASASAERQPGLIAGEPGDACERQADRAAERVMRTPAPGLQHRKETAQEDVEGMLRRDATTTTPAPCTSALEPAAAPLVHESLGAPGHPLEPDARTDMEARFGRDFGPVRVHTDDQAVASARAVHARAFTVGRDVVFGKGQYAPGSTAGRLLLAHELAHTIQQDGLPQDRAQRLLQATPLEASAGCIEPSMPAGAETPGSSFVEGASEIRGDATWVLRLWDFARNEAIPTIGHLTAMQAFFAAADLRRAQERNVDGWAVVSIVGHASPEGEEDHNTELAQRRAEAVSGLIGGNTAPVSSGEACGEGVPREAYPYFRAVDVAIEFIQESVPPAVHIPDVDPEPGKSPGSKIDPNKALKDASGARAGIVDAVIEIVTPDDPAKGPPKIGIDFKKGIEGGGEGVSKGLADVAFELNTQRSFDQQLKDLEPQIKAQLASLRPAAERMFMDDPSRPVYAIVHTMLPKTQVSASDTLSETNPGVVRLAEPVTLTRERVSRQYENKKVVNGIPKVTVIEKHVIKSIEIRMVSED